MYSILLSKIESIYLVEEELKKIIKNNYKVVIIPWTFPIETDSQGLDKYFSGERYNKYISPLKRLGININNIMILNCYRDNIDYMKKCIEESDVLVLPGGNPEMMYDKIMHAGLIDSIKKFEKIVIGSSAGTELQLENYFITAKNNYYKKFAWYKGFGLLHDPFYIDVHSSNNYKYKNKLQEVARDKKKNLYALFNDGAMIYKRDTKDIKLFGNVIVYKY